MHTHTNHTLRYAIWARKLALWNSYTNQHQHWIVSYHFHDTSSFDSTLNLHLGLKWNTKHIYHVINVANLKFCQNKLQLHIDLFNNSSIIYLCPNATLRNMFRARWAMMNPKSHGNSRLYLECFYANTQKSLLGKWHPPWRLPQLGWGTLDGVYKESVPSTHGISCSHRNTSTNSSKIWRLHFVSPWHSWPSPPSEFRQAAGSSGAWGPGTTVFNIRPTCTGARFRSEKVVSKIVTKIVTRSNFDSMTCVNY